MRRFAIATYLLLFAVPVPIFAARQGPRTSESKPVSFIREVAPILVGKCQACHGPKTAESNYRLDSFEAIDAAGRLRIAAHYGRRSGGQRDSSADHGRRCRRANAEQRRPACRF